MCTQPRIKKTNSNGLIIIVLLDQFVLYIIVQNEKLFLKPDAKLNLLQFIVALVSTCKYLKMAD